MEELYVIKSKLDFLVKDMENVNCFLTNERDTVFEIEKDIIYYFLKNKVKNRGDLGYLNTLIKYIKNRINQGFIPNSNKIEKLYKLIREI